MVPPAHLSVEIRKEAKPQDAGARVEHSAIRKLQLAHLKSQRVDCWRRPGIRVARMSGARYVPDGAGYLPELEGLVIERTPDVRDPRPSYNFMIEVKGQTTSGSAFHKIVASIEDLGHAGDVLGIPSVLVLDLPALPASEVRSLKSTGRLHSVVVVTIEELSRDLLVSELTRVAREQRSVARRIGPRGGFKPPKRLKPFEVGAVYRIRKRHENARRLVTYGAQASLMRIA